MSQIIVTDKHDNRLPLIDVRLAVGQGLSEEAYDDKRTDHEGACAFPVVLPSQTGYQLWFNTRNINSIYGYDNTHVDRVDAQDIHIKLEREELPRITKDGLFFNKFIKGESAFLDYYRFLRGEDITPLLKQSMKYGSNCRRIFGMTHYTGVAGNIGPQKPDMYHDFYDKFPKFLDLYESFGIYLYMSVFPDNGLVGWNNPPRQIDHWNKLGEIARNHSAFFALELTNEPDAKDFNHVDANIFSPISGVLCCSGGRGDTGSDPMPDPQWDFCDHHTRRNPYPTLVGDECKAIHPSRVQRNKIMFSGEAIGFGDKSLNGNREDNPRIAKEIAGTGRGTCAGMIFHSQHGGFSQLYDRVENECALAYFGELK